MVSGVMGLSGKEIKIRQKIKLIQKCCNYILHHKNCCKVVEATYVASTNMQTNTSICIFYCPSNFFKIYRSIKLFKRKIKKTKFCIFFS